MPPVYSLPELKACNLTLAIAAKVTDRDEQMVMDRFPFSAAVARLKLQNIFAVIFLGKIKNSLQNFFCVRL
jgi:hypothetical protein